MLDHHYSVNVVERTETHDVCVCVTYPAAGFSLLLDNNNLGVAGRLVDGVGSLAGEGELTKLRGQPTRWKATKE